MANDSSMRRPEDERDLIDAIPGLERFSSNLQRSVGPSCLFGLIITALLVIVIRRYFRIPLPGMILLTFVVWWAVLVILVRLGRGPGDEDD
jgi:hypothetical protein